MDWPPVEQRLKSEIEAHVEAWIDDELEKAGQPAKFSKEPRYDLWHWVSADVLAILPTGRDVDDLPGHWRIFVDSEFQGRAHRLSNLRRKVESNGLIILGEGGHNGPPGYEHLCVEGLALSVWEHLTTPTVWSIVKINAHLDDEQDWNFLGRIAVNGDTMITLDNDDSLRWELLSGPGVIGSREDIEAIIAGHSYHIAIAVDNEEFDQWIQERLSDLAREREAEREAERAWEGGADDENDQEDDDNA